MILDVFDTKIYYHENIEFDQYNIDTRFGKSLIELLESFRSYPDVNARGHSLSSVSLPAKILYIPGFRGFYEILLPYIKQGFLELNLPCDEDPRIVRAWANLVTAGTDSRIHVHSIPSVRLVSIFYFSVDSNSGQLTFCESGNDRKFIDQATGEKVTFPTRTGTLVCHDPRIPHAVTRHDLVDPRISIIIEFA